MLSNFKQQKVSASHKFTNYIGSGFFLNMNTRVRFSTKSFSKARVTTQEKDENLYLVTCISSSSALQFAQH
ncbi:CLUMA_CG014625, isoform A [Clunio marinus]|uniref:CLUMA_CG014625, isoform A n=1 Tax=Clunio marinus TaxID=568069 RepID=A0A1J1IS59_9DIPT|nr:CLUMA_CG014625, isoform A [Clunio marinus]